jgi:hypothetical protein
MEGLKVKDLSSGPGITKNVFDSTKIISQITKYKNELLK